MSESATPKEDTPREGEEGDASTSEDTSDTEVEDADLQEPKRAKVAQDIPAPGDFSSFLTTAISDLTSAYEAVTSVNGWADLRESSNPMRLENITGKIAELNPGHSGSSMGFVVTHMHYIATKGWEAYVKFMLELEV